MNMSLKELTEKRDAILADTMTIEAKIASLRETHMRAEGLAATLGKEDTPAAARGTLAALSEAKDAMTEISALRSKLEPLKRKLNGLQDAIRTELETVIRERRKVAIEGVHEVFKRAYEIEEALVEEMDELAARYGIELPSYSKILGLVTSARPA